MKILSFYDGIITRCTMKSLRRLFIFLALHKVVKQVHGNNIEIYASLLDTVEINCRVEFKSASDVFMWQRRNTLIARGCYIMPSFLNNKFQIVVDQYKKEYTLKISNITKEDLGEYVCETQISNRVNQKNYILKLIEYKSTTLNEIMSTQDNPATEYTSTALTEIISTQDYIATGNPFFVMSTASHSQIDFNNEKHHETGLSFPEVLYYILPAVGLVLICLAILCYTRIHTKCRTVVVKTRGNVHKTNDLNTQCNYPEQIDVVERHDDDTEDYNTHYVTINESEMLPIHVIAAVADITNIPKHSSSVSEKLYHEIIEDEVKQNILKEPGIELINLNHLGTLDSVKNNMLLETKLDPNTVNVPCLEVGNKCDSYGLSDDSDDITCLKSDDYLHPYTTLNVNDMEYLNSYSTVINIDQTVSVEPLQLSDSNSSFFLEKDIVLDESAVN